MTMQFITYGCLKRKRGFQRRKCVCVGQLNDPFYLSWEMEKNYASANIWGINAIYSIQQFNIDEKNILLEAMVPWSLFKVLLLGYYTLIPASLPIFKTVFQVLMWDHQLPRYILNHFQCFNSNFSVFFLEGGTSSRELNLNCMWTNKLGWCNVIPKI